MRILARLIIPLVLLAGPAGAQTRITFENDLFSPHPLHRKAPDYEYTAGTRLSWVSGDTRWWASRLGALTGSPADTAGGGARLRTIWEVAQEIYTPRVDAAKPVPGERPYAGWLYGAVTAEASRRARTRTLSLRLGVTGPPSLAAPVQRGLHHIGGFQTPLGWSHQLAFEPGVALRYGESWAITPDLGGAAAELAPEWEMTLGNVLTGARAGLRGKLGTGGLRRGGDGIYATAAVRGEWVGRNLFLDGNTFQGGPRVRKRPFVPQAEVGAGVHLGWLGIAYRATYRGREYRTQQKPHGWGSISLEAHPRWGDAGR